MVSEERKEAFLRAWFDAPEGVHWAHGMSNEIEQNVSDCFDKAIAAWTTPVSPDVTGKCGELETIGYVTPGWLDKHCSAHTISAQQTPAWTEAVVTRSQAVGLLAAEREEKEELRRAIMGDEPGHDLQHGNFIEMAATLHRACDGGRKRAEYAEQRLGQSEAELKQARTDNAALTARVKELEKDFYDADKSDISARDLLNDQDAKKKPSKPSWRRLKRC